MSDRFLFQLAEGWALGADDLQWMLLRARKRHAETVWQPVVFIASTKSILRRCMAESGIRITANVQALLDELPERFQEWREINIAEQRTVSSAA